MRRPLVTALVVPSVLVALAAASCDAFAGDDPSPEPRSSATPTTSPAPTLSADGYLYTDKQGIRALAAFDGDRGTLQIRNTTGAELAPPGLYLLDARSGALVEAEVTPSRGLTDGEERSFRVALARAMPPASIGLVVLLIGNEDRGAFLPPAARATP